MRWRAFAGQKQEKFALLRDLAGADREEKICLGEENLFILRLFTVDYLPYDAVTWAYRRIEEARGTLCCGVATYEIHHLVIEAGGRTMTVRFETREACVACLEWIAKKNPGARIGYPAA